MPSRRRTHFDYALLVELDFAWDRRNQRIVVELLPTPAQLGTRQPVIALRLGGGGVHQVSSGERTLWIVRAGLDGVQ